MFSSPWGKFLSNLRKCAGILEGLQQKTAKISKMKDLSKLIETGLLFD